MTEGDAASAADFGLNEDLDFDRRDREPTARRSTSRSSPTDENWGQNYFFQKKDRGIGSVSSHRKPG